MTAECGSESPWKMDQTTPDSELVSSGTDRGNQVQSFPGKCHSSDQRKPKREDAVPSLGLLSPAVLDLDLGRGLGHLPGCQVSVSGSQSGQGS